MPGSPLPEPDRAGRAPPHMATVPGDGSRADGRSERLGGFPQWSHLLPVEDGPDGAADGSRSRRPTSLEKALPFQTLTEPSPLFSTAPCSLFVGDPTEVAVKKQSTLPEPHPPPRQVGPEWTAGACAL